MCADMVDLGERDDLASFVEISFSSFGSFGVGSNRSGKATDASSVSYGKKDAFGNPKNTISQESAMTKRYYCLS